MKVTAKQLRALEKAIGRDTRATIALQVRTTVEDGKTFQYSMMLPTWCTERGIYFEDIAERVVREMNG
jgi:hypothetical protein